MGHLLATVNPEAAAAIKPTSPLGNRVAPLHQIVRYHSRPGEGRAGKMSFPAFMMHCDPENGRAQLLVIYAADDLQDRINIPYRSDENPFAAWDYINPLEAPVTLRAGNLENGMDRVFGEHGLEEGQSVMGLIAELRREIEALKAKRGPGRPRNDMLPES